MNELERMLQGAAQVGQPVPLIKQLVLTRYSWSSEQDPNGNVLIHIDVLLSAQAAERYTLVLDAESFGRFAKFIAAAGSPIDVPQLVSKIDGGQLQ